MLPIVAPIKAKDTGPQVDNLIVCLLFLLERGIITAYDAPKQPTKEELEKLVGTVNQELLTQTFGRASSRPVFYLQVQEGLGDGLKGAVDDKTAQMLNRLLLENGVVFDESDLWIVEGVVRQGDAPVAGALVKVFHRDLRVTQPIGLEAKTDANGHYQIRFRTQDFHRGSPKQRPTPWLVVEARANDTAPVVTVEKRAGVQQREVLDVQLGTVASVEFEQILSLVGPFLIGQGRGGRDVTVYELLPSDAERLAQKTGLDAVKVALFVDAASSVPRLAGHVDEASRPDTALGLAELLYGLLRAGAADRVDGLTVVNRPSLEAAAAWAADRGIVSAALAGKSAGLLDVWDRVRAPVAAKSVVADGRKTTQSLLAGLGKRVPASLASRVELAAARHGGLHLAALAELDSATDLKPKERAALPHLRTALALSEATGGDAAVFDALLRAGSALPQIERPEQIVRLSRADWLRVAESIETPQGDPVEPADQRAARLMRHYDGQHLQAAAQWRLEQGDLQLSGTAKTRLSALIEQHPEAGLGGAGSNAIALAIKASSTTPDSLDPESREILHLDAMVRACGTTLDVSDLERAGFRSIDDAADAGRHQFTQTMVAPVGGGSGWTAERAHATYDRLTGAAAAGTLAFVGSAVARSSPVPAALRRGAATLADLSATALCACEGCRSVLSVSAYLADLLRFLRDARTTGRSPYAELIRRRPDVQEVLLDCANENGEVRYVDLVNEVLERALVNAVDPGWLANLTFNADVQDNLNGSVCPTGLRDDLTAAGIRLSPTVRIRTIVAGNRWRVYDGQWVVDLVVRRPISPRQPAGLSAKPWPQSVDEAAGAERPQRLIAAYETLAEARYPWALPFDLPQQILRHTLETRGMSEGELRTVFGTGTWDECRRRAALTRMQLSERVVRDLDSAVTLSEEQLAARWGFSDVKVQIDDPAPQSPDAPGPRPRLLGWKVIGSRLSVFMRSTGLTFDEVNTLLATAFVNADRSLRIQSVDAADLQSCDIRKLAIAGLTRPERFQAIERFVRLARSARLRLDELDLLLTAVAVPEWEQTVRRLSIALAVRDRLRLSCADAAALWAPISLRSYASGLAAPLTKVLSHFDRIFRANATVASVLPEDPSGASGWPSLEELRPLLADALGTGSAELDDWFAAAGLSGSEVGSLGALTNLYRHRLIARALGISALELKRLTAVLGESPFFSSSSNDVEAVGRFIDRAALCRSLSPTVDPIDYVLRPEGTSHGVHEAVVATTAQRLAGQLASLSDQSDEVRGDAVTRAIAELSGVDYAGARELSGRWLKLPSERGVDQPQSILAALSTSSTWPADIGTAAPPIDRRAAPEVFSALTLARKAGVLIQMLGLARSHWAWAFEGAPAVSLDLNALPTRMDDAPLDFRRFERLAGWVQLARSLRLTEAQMGALFAGLSAGDRHGVHSLLAEFVQIPRADIDALLLDHATSRSPWRTTFPDDYWSSQLCERLRIAAAYGARLQVAPARLNAWFESDGGGFTDRLLRAEVARSTALAALSGTDRARVESECSTRLSDGCRAALVAYLTHHKDASDSSTLFAHYLIDAEMSADQRTTRVAQAVFATQLFVQRCLLNLEPGIALAEDDAREWNQFRKWGQGWKANRRIFLYPENWLEPEFRDDKSPFFKELESSLQQSDLTSDRAAEAFGEYLDRLGLVSRLELVSLLTTTDDHRREVTHVFARTRHSPAAYFYRQRVKGLRWTAWERIESDVEGDFVIPIVHGDRLQLIWAAISEDGAGGSGTGGAESWKMQFARSRRTPAGWRAKEMIGQPRSCPRLPGKEASDSFLFRTSPGTGEDVRVLAFVATEIPQPKVVAAPAVLSDWVPRNTDVTKPNDISYTNPFRWTLTLRFVYESRQELGVPGLDIVGIGIDTTERPFGTTDARGLCGVDIPPGSQLSVRLVLKNHPEVQPTFHSLANDPRRGNYVKAGTTGLDIDARYYEGMDIPVMVPIDPPLQAVNPARSVSWRQIEGLVCEPSGNIGDGAVDPNATLAAPRDAMPHGMGYSPTRPALHLSASPTSKSVLHVLSGKGPLLGSVQRSGMFISVPGQGYFLPVGTHPDLGFDSPFGLSATSGAYLGDSTQQLMIHYGLDGSVQVGSRGAVSLQPLYYSRDSALLDAWARHGLAALVSPELQAPGRDQDVLPTVRPSGDSTVSVSFVPEGVEFDHLRPSAVYNWEVFFHIPWLVAIRLSDNKRFREAQRWFHTILDPTVGQSGNVTASPLDAWRCRPLREALEGGDSLLDVLADGATLSRQVQLWEEQPFQPHVLARYRLRSYAIAVLKSYIENLVAWGEHIARRQTVEALNEATQLYLLAKELLGERQTASVNRGARSSETFSLLTDFDAFSNPAPAGIPTSGGVSNSGVPRFDTRYFCIPPNEDLLDLWARVEAGLQRMRSGVGTLFGPPVDPAILMRAAAQGLDVEDVLSGLTDPGLPYRFGVVIQKAMQVASEVKALGATLLSAIEKRDAEELLLLRTRHERALSSIQRDIRTKQVAEAEAELVALGASRAGAVERLTHFRQLLALTTAPAPPHGSAIDRVEQVTALAREAFVDADPRQLGLSRREVEYLKRIAAADKLSSDASFVSALASVGHFSPNFSWGTPALSTSYGGSNIGQGLSAVSTVLQALSANETYNANKTSTIGSHERRRDDWAYQHNTVAAEIEYLDKQIDSARLRSEIATKDLEHQRTVSANAEEVDQFLKSKFSSSQLYNWMIRQSSSCYFRAYQLALELAVSAQKAFERELAPARAPQFIRPAYWDSLREGLLVGEQLAVDLARLDAEYMRANTREIELTKHVSLALLDPLALIALRLTGECEFRLPEVLFDLDFPGHYLRRIKSVAVSLPCVVGPYTSVSGTLRLEESRTRRTPTTSLEVDTHPPASRIIATSTAQADSGMFESTLRDERYLPFEGGGVADSRWRFTLPSAFKTFDYETIADLVLQIRYTARPDDTRAASVQTALRDGLNAVVAVGQAGGGWWRAFSLRHEFPAVWAAMRGSASLPGAIKLENQQFSALLRNRSLRLDELKAFAFYLVAPSGIDRPQLRLQYSVSGTTQTQRLTLDLEVAGTRAFERAVTLTSSQPVIGPAGWPVTLALEGSVGVGELDDLIICTRVNILEE
jgi:hypothetical protein